MNYIVFPKNVNKYLLTKAEDVTRPEKFRINPQCTYIIDDASKATLYSAMAKGGLLPTSVKKPAEGTKDNGEGKKTFGAQKPAQKPYLERLRGENVPGWLKNPRLGGLEMVDTKFMEKFCREMDERANYSYKSSHSEVQLAKKGAPWHGWKQNLKSKKRILDTWDAYRPLYKSAFMLTLKEPESVKKSSADVLTRFTIFNQLWHGVSRKLQGKFGYHVYGCIEYGSSDMWHVHAVICTADGSEFPPEMIRNVVEDTDFRHDFDLRSWNLDDRPEYITKNLSQNLEGILKCFDEGKEPDIYMKESFMLWYACYMLNVRPFTNPASFKKNLDEARDEMGGKPNEKIAHALMLPKGERQARRKGVPEDFSQLTERKKAQDAFKDTHCKSCSLPCGLGEWLRQCVFVPDDVPFVEIMEFLKQLKGESC